MARREPLADLIVLARDLPELRLIVEIKRGGHFDRPAAIQQLASYMARSNCPLGLMVTPRQTWMLRDTYEGEDSIREVAVYDTAVLLGVAEIPDNENDLEMLVGSWLDGLTSGSAASVAKEVRPDVARYLLPAVAEGRVESGRFG
ncbi:hypothetical protein [Enhygromyxa salina]|nr:hypothetical protein [Enhygromyxa salina]